jgi:hypothetical protein
MDRVERIRNQEFQFIDSVDQQYSDLHQEMSTTYDLWRQYGRERAIYLEDYQARVANSDRQGRKGSFIALEQVYNAYKLGKIQDQDLKQLAKGFNNEVEPTVMNIQGKVFELNGSLDGQYAQWRSILRSIFALETGLAPSS